MEENIAILIADLTGYTALTETHGSVSAANLIDRFQAIIETCLVGDSKVHERTGDEVMIISKSADFLLATALMMLKKTSIEDNFLQIHGGLHYGKILKRNNSYFGTTINLTSRIASKAEPGNFWCSEEFVNFLTDKSLTKFHSKGRHGFKNINEEKEMFMISAEFEGLFFVDPVCRMLLIDANNAVNHPESNDIFFCSTDCLNIYTKSNLKKVAAH
jgi:class 3 adenylate cyclase